MITHNITLRIKDQNALDTGIAVSQGDYGRVKFVIYVKDGETYLSGAETAELAFTTPNGYIVTGNVTIETGAYSYIFQGNELQAAGKVSAVLTLTFSDGRVSTCGFLFVCRYNPMYDRNMDAGPYLGEIETLKSAAQFALDDARGAAAVAEAAKEAAVSAANNAEAVSGVGIATSQKAGLVKPDGSTTSVDAEGILSIILKDTHGILGTENATVMMQALIDAIADKVMDQVLTKAMLINNGLTTESGKYPLDAAYGKTLLDLYTKLNSETYTLYEGTLKVGDIFSLSENIGLYNIVRIQTGQNNLVYSDSIISSDKISLSAGLVTDVVGSGVFVLMDFAATTSDGKNYTVVRNTQININESGMQHFIRGISSQWKIIGIK